MHALSGKVYARKVERMSYHETIDGLVNNFPKLALFTLDGVRIVSQVFALVRALS